MHDYSKYFKEQPGFDRFIVKLYEKFQSLSKFSGTIKLSNLSQEEAICLSKLFGMSYKKGDNVTLSIKKFILIMNSSRYEDFNINTLVEEYLQVPLMTKKEVKDIDMNEEEEFYNSIILSSNSKGKKWLRDVVNKRSAPYLLIHQRYKRDKEGLRKDLRAIITMIDNLPNEKIMLSLFSATYTKDPHYLDLETGTSNLFIYALSNLDGTNFPTTREEKISLLSKYNIEIDALSNFVITYNLLSSKSYINEFAKNKESLILNIQNIMSASSFDTKTKMVFIFENPSILTEIMSNNLDISVIISGGFPNACVYLLLDKLLASGNKLYYNGDFDPEGLLIADKLKDKYKDNIELFCYDDIDYKMCISKKKISLARLNKLSKVKAKELINIKKLLIENEIAVYQENNKDRIIKFLKRKTFDDKVDYN